MGAASSVPRLGTRVGMVKVKDTRIRFTAILTTLIGLVPEHVGPLLCLLLRSSLSASLSAHAANATFLMVPWTSGFLNCRPNSPMYSSTQPSTPGF